MTHWAAEALAELLVPFAQIDRRAPTKTTQEQETGHKTNTVGVRNQSHSQQGSATLLPQTAFISVSRL